ncbi:MAG: hypothetical protein JO101_08265 [Candidatus Eremiobacteraeota bacterium]|nr:hypothetical protein [Candidatus Eremiobacteraeota bacterium]
MTKYPVTMSLCTILQLVGWLCVLIGSIIFLWGILSFGSANDNQGLGAAFSGISGLMKVITGAGFASYGLVNILIAELVKVHIDIESNTYRTAKLLDEVSSALKLRQLKGEHIDITNG